MGRRPDGAHRRHRRRSRHAGSARDRRRVGDRAALRRDRRRPTRLPAGRGGRRAGGKGRDWPHARSTSRSRGARPAGDRRRAHRAGVPRRSPPQLEDRSRPARTLGGGAARRWVGARGASDARARHRRFRPARADDDRGARGCAATTSSRCSGIGARSSTCEQVLADVCDVEAVTAAAAGCDAVVHGAARVGVLGSREEFRRVNVGGTESVVAACRAAGVPRLVVVSSPSVGYESVPTVGAGAGAPITARPTARGIRSRRPRPRLAALAANDPALAVTAIRPHAIWGPGDTQLIGRIVERARPGRLFVVGGGTALIDTTYVDNAADALVSRRRAARPAGRLAGRSLRRLERRAAARAGSARADLRCGRRAAPAGRSSRSGSPVAWRPPPSACGLAPGPVQSRPRPGSSSISSLSPTGSTRGRSARRPAGGPRSAWPRECAGWRPRLPSKLEPRRGAAWTRSEPARRHCRQDHREGRGFGRPDGGLFGIRQPDYFQRRLDPTMYWP